MTNLAAERMGYRRSLGQRKAVYTTNAVEPVNYTLQRNLKIHQSFPNDGAAMKLCMIRHLDKKSKFNKIMV